MAKQGKTTWTPEEQEQYNTAAVFLYGLSSNRLLQEKAGGYWGMIKDIPENQIRSYLSAVEVPLEGVTFEKKGSWLKLGIPAGASSEMLQKVLAAIESVIMSRSQENTALPPDAAKAGLPVPQA
ncbi:MAG: hypothetical protein M3O22_05990 [Pseudomonadota bacterium]|nr:hypothetical protein [Pseudomonadota bacterium]